MQNSDFWTRITSLYGSQTSPVVLCMQNSVISTRMTSLYGSQPSSVVFVHAKQRLLDQNYKSLWVPDLICDFLHDKTATFGPEIACLYGSQNSPVIFALQNTCLASELLVSMGPSPHLWFLHAKQRLLEPNNKSLWVPDITCHSVHAIQSD